MMNMNKVAAITVRTVRWLVQAVTFVALIFALPGHAQVRDTPDCDLSGYQSSVRPDPPGTPTEVTIGLLLVDLSAINDVDQTVMLDALLTLQWTDDRLRSAAGCQYSYSDIWTPQIQLANSSAIRPRQTPMVLIEANGSVTTTVRYDGSVSSPADLREFPFDERAIKLQLVSVKYDVAELPFRISPDWTGRRADLSVPDWTIGEPTVAVSELELPRVEKKVSLFEFGIPAVRHGDYYIYKFVFPLCLIIMMSWSVFWIDPGNLGPQLSLAATSMLTLVAYQFTINDLLPRVGYLTAMDQYVLSSSLLVFLALLEALITGSLAGSGRVEVAKALDRISRWMFPVAYLLVILFTLIL